jgi:hypothetical protein
MGYGKLIFILAGLPVGALAGALLGLDAHANEWSRRPIFLFSAVGAILFTAVMVYLRMRGGVVVRLARDLEHRAFA